MNLPEVNVSSEELYRMLYAPIKARLLMSGIELKVFNHLSEPKSAKEVAEEIGGHSRNTMLFLNGLAACDLIEKHNGLYKNASIAEAFLVEGCPTYLGEGFGHQASMTDVMLTNLTKLIREGPPLQPSGDDADPRRWSQFASWMAK